MWVIRKPRHLMSIWAAAMAWQTAIGFAVALGPEDLQEYKSTYYTIHTNLDRDEAKIFGRHMDKTYWVYARRFQSFRNRERRSMPLYLVRTRDDYISLMARFGVDASASGGMFFYSREANGLATWVEGIPKSNALETLQHEGFHQFAYAYIGRQLPLWVNEGLAEYFGDGILVRHEMKIGFATHHRLQSVQEAIREDTAIGFDDLLDMTSERWHQNMISGSAHGRIQYDQSWSIVYFLIHGDGGRYRKAFEKYLKIVSNGRHSSKAFRQAFGTKDTAAFRKRWVRYIQNLEPDAFSTAINRMKFLARGLKYLKDNERPIPRNLNQLRANLSKVNFRIQSTNPGKAIIMTAKDADVFEYTLRSGAKHRLRF